MDLKNLLVAVTACGSVCGCAFSYEDSKGDSHVIGLLDVVTKRHEANGENAQSANSLNIRTVGLSLISDEADQRQIALGYTEIKTISLPNNFCLDINNSNVCLSKKIREPSE